MSTAILRAHGGLEQQVPAPNRSDVLARYRRLREINKHHNAKVMDFLSTDTVLHHARRLGLAAGRTFMLDSMDEMALVFDLAIYTAPMGRSRAIDRYARSVSFSRESDEALVLKAMCGACFAIIAVRDRHPAAGLLVTDVFRKTDLWLVDEGLERSLDDRELYATRYYRLDEFVITAGVGMPVDAALLEIVLAQMPQLLDKLGAEAIDDRRFAEAVYHAAIADGVMQGVSYQDPDGDDA